MADSPNIVDDRYGYVVWIPETTPRGQAVTIQSGERNGAHIMHAESPDQSELYFEITAYERILDQGELARGQQDFLRANSGDGNVTPISAGVVAGFAGTTFDFAGSLAGRWKERRFLFVDGEHRTFRVVHDPTSALNLRVLESLRLGNKQQEFAFRPPGRLVEGDLELILLEARSGDAARGLVPEYKFEMYERPGGSKAGDISLRTSLTPRLAEFGGHIGYDVAEPFRGHGYAARSCRLLFDLARFHGISPLLITCGEDNFASRRTCEKIGATLVKIADAETDTGETRSTCYYHVDL